MIRIPGDGKPVYVRCKQKDAEGWLSADDLIVWATDKYWAWMRRGNHYKAETYYALMKEIHEAESGER